MPVPPIYEPEEVAEAIVRLAEHPQRLVMVGGSGKLLNLLDRLSPALGDWLILKSGMADQLQKTTEPDDGHDNFFAPMAADTYRIRGDFSDQAKAHSLYTRLLELHPTRKRMLTGTLMMLVGVLAALGLKRLRPV